MIKAYLFSDITRQISHTYYSLHGTTIGPSKFFYNLKDYEVRKFSLLESFIYEVEIYPESVVGCFDDYIEARKYKIIRNVKFVEYLNEKNLSDEIAEEFNAILNGNYLDLSLIVELRKLLKKKILNLTIYERFKFLVILNQAKIDIPLISLEENYQIYYIKLLEFYGVSYDCSKLNYHKSEIEEQKYFGNTEFEILNHQTGYIYDALFENRYYASNLIRARKITQAQFEVFCEGVRIGDYIPNLDSSGLVSGYKIPNKYLNIFYPNISHLELEDISSLIANWNIDTNIATKFLENNYMIEGFDYSSKECQKIIEAKKIFLKDDFKIIERKELC
jgi:hypothetical protein